MSTFTSELLTKDRSKEPPPRIRFELIAPLVYESDILKRTITVPTGFVTDFASIPQMLWNVLPPIGAYDEAAVVHDYLYATNGMGREQADQVLKEAMGVLQVGFTKKWLIYSGVRVGGWHAWNWHRSQDKT